MGSHILKGDLSYPSKRIPLPWATAILIILILPLGFYLGKWNFTLWVSFIVWAEYFALGAKVDTWKLIMPSIPFGAVFGAAWCTSAVALCNILTPYWGPVNGLYAAFALTNLIWVPLILYGLRWHHAFTAGTLAVFNGLGLQLAVYFTGSLPKVGPMENAYFVIWWSFLWSVLMAYVGWFFGWFNIVLTFPRKPGIDS
jgi:hypothetical protein